MQPFSNRLKTGLSIRNMRPSELCRMTGIGKSAMSQYMSGAFRPKQDNTYKIAKALDVSETWLMGFDVPMERERSKSDARFPSPNITDEYTTFPVIGNIAAGYDHIAVENWEGDTINVPDDYLVGHNKEDFFVLRVVGDSMYPMYHENDKVLILKQSTLTSSGEIGAVLYDDEIATLKKVEYAYGEDWLRLVPINPIYKPEFIEGEKLEHCRIIGVPKLLIREI